MPDPSTRITNHVVRAQAELPSHEQSATNLMSILEVAGNAVQQVEDTLDDMVNKRHLTVARGVILDHVGELLDVNRNGLNDDDYRLQIQGEAARLGQSGEVPNLLIAYRRLMTLFGIMEDNELIRYRPATIGMVAVLTAADIGDLTLSDVADADVDGNGPQGDDIDSGLGDASLPELGDFLPITDGALLQVANAMQAVRAAGVRLFLMLCLETDGLSFVMGDANDASGPTYQLPISSGGLDDVNDTGAGGLLGNIFSNGG